MYGGEIMENKIPTHLAIIPDGNRRWARERGRNAYYGHRHGVGAFEEMARYGFDAGIKYISMWGMSVDNLKNRSKTEVAGLFRIFRSEFGRLAESADIHKQKVKINVLGEWEKKLPVAVKRPIRKAIEATKDYKNHYLNFLLLYNGTNEMIEAVQAMVDAGRAARKKVRVTPGMIKENLLTKDLPPVDMVIRTGGEPHLSNGFMMWDVADAELYFSDKYWPDFKKKELDQALRSYGRRRRKKGA